MEKYNQWFTRKNISMENGSRSSIQTYYSGTEYGVYVSLNQGEKWHKFSNGLPTIPVRDLTIQRRENDLVLATFGRSFYVLDDFSPLRNFSEEKLNKDVLAEPRKHYNTPMIGGTSIDGGASFKRKNPAYGSTISYFIKDGFKSLTAQRTKKKMLRALAMMCWRN